MKSEPAIIIVSVVGSLLQLFLVYRLTGEFDEAALSTLLTILLGLGVRFKVFSPKTVENLEPALSKKIVETLKSEKQAREQLAGLQRENEILKRIPGTTGK